MKQVFYKKVGRRYVPVSEYDSELCSALPKGAHLIVSYPGGQSTHYNINPNYAAMIAAGRVAEEAISKAIHDATEIRKSKRNKELTPKQKAAWDNLVKELGESARQLEWASVRECAEAGVKALHKEADKLMQHEAVRLAYEQFLLVCELTKEHNAETR